MDKVKWILYSKTFWLNVIGATLEILSLLTPLIPAEAAKWIAFGVAAANIVLRWSGNIPLSIKKPV